MDFDRAKMHQSAYEKNRYKIDYKVLEADGFKAHKTDKEHAECLLQKAFYDRKKNIKYFLNFYIWDFAAWNIPRNQYRFATSVECLLYLPTGDAVEVNFHITPETTLKDVYAFYEGVYKKLKCVPDLHNN